MLPIISGTVRNAVNLTVLDNKWKQKKESGNLFQKELTPEQKMVNQFQEDMQKMRENNEIASIGYKLKAGNELSFEEIEYLQKNAPQLYQEYLEMKSEKKAYERQLKNCKTQEEVDRLKINKMNGILAQAKSVLNNPSIPKSAKLALAEKFLMKTMGIQDAHMKFVESGRYAALPTEEEVAEEEKAKTEASEKVAEALAPEEQENVQEEESGEETSAETVKDRENIAGDITADDKVVKADNGKNSVEVPDLKKEPKDVTAIFAEVRKELVGFIQKNRPSGYGLEYLADDFTERSQRKSGK